MPGYGSGTYGSGTFSEDIAPVGYAPGANAKTLMVTSQALGLLVSPEIAPLPPVPEKLTIPMKVYYRDSTLTRVAEIDQYTELEMNLRFNRVSGWILQIPADSPVVSLVNRGGGIIVVRDGQTIMSGPIDTIRRQFGVNQDRLILAGVDDTAMLANLLALPVPQGPPYTAAAYDVRTGPAETVMRAYVDANAGPGAPVARRQPGLTLAPDLARGASVTHQARFAPLLETLQGIALAGGDMGFRIVQIANSLQFQVYEPVDNTGYAKFALDMGNLAEYDYTIKAPDANYVYVGGGGEGTERMITEAADAGSVAMWRRREAFRDRRDTVDPAEMARTAQEELKEHGESAQLAIHPIDTTFLAFGQHYGLGDKISVVAEGETIQDILREVRITLNQQGETIRPAAGSAGMGDGVLRMFESLRRLYHRVGNLERL